MLTDYGSHFKDSISMLRLMCCLDLSFKCFFLFDKFCDDRHVGISKLTGNLLYFILIAIAHYQCVNI